MSPRSLSNLFSLVSQDNTSLIVWKVDGWKAECKITEPFMRSPETIMFRRPSWSSDGSLLIGSAAASAGMHIPLLIEREKWTHTYFPVGHKAWVSVTASNPSVFAAANGTPYLCYALADVNQVLTVWATNQDSARLAIGHCMDKPVTDLRWSPNGNLLLITSLDGSILVIDFAEGELGRQLSEKEKQARRSATYGSASGALFEDAALLSIYQEKQQKMQEEAKAASAQHRVAPSAPSVQTETRVNGKRKITPVLVDGNEIRSTTPSDSFKNVFAVGNMTPLKTGSSATDDAASSAPAASGQVPITPIAPSPVRNVTTSGGGSHMAVDSDASEGNGIDRRRAKATSSAEDVNVDAHRGAKKTNASAPSVSSLFSSSSASPSAAFAASVSTPTAPPKPAAHAPLAMLPPPNRALFNATSPPPNGASAAPIGGVLPPVGSISPATGGMSLISQLQTHEFQQKRQRGRAGRKPKQTAATMDVDDDTAVDDDRGISSNAGSGGGTNLLLPLPVVARRFVKKIARGTSSDSVSANSMDEAHQMGSEQSECLLEVVVNVDDDGLRPPKSVLKFFEGGSSVIWQDHIEDKVTVLTGNTSHVIAAGCSSGDVYIYSPSGRRLFPAINVGESAICALECLASTLMAISTEGVVKMWDVALGIAKADTTLDSLMLRHFTAQSERNPINGAATADGANPGAPSWCTETDDGSLILNDFVSKFAVSESGQALCVLQSGQIYGYSTMMAAWTCLYAPNWQKDVDKSGLALGQLSTLQRSALRFPAVQASTQSYSSYHGLAVEEKRQRTVAHLETQLASTALFGTSKEYKHFAKLYVRELADLMHERKLTEFTTSLLGPVNHSLQANASWDPFILGVPKREILEEVLPEMLRPELQRLVISLKEALESANRIAAANRQLRSPPMARAVAVKDASIRVAESPSVRLGSGQGAVSASTPSHSAATHTPSQRSGPITQVILEDETTSDSVTSSASRGNRRKGAQLPRPPPSFTIDDEEAETSQTGISRASSKSSKRAAASK